MNVFQQIWWEQVKSDHQALEILRRHGAAMCHQLHYLQMVTEKLAKAYYWRSNQAPKFSHKGLVRFLQTLLDRRQDRLRIVQLLDFKTVTGFEAFVNNVAPLAHAIEALAPSLSNGPNPEYPWPPGQPVCAPATFHFPEARIFETSLGRQLLKVIARTIEVFPDIA